MYTEETIAPYLVQNPRSTPIKFSHNYIQLYNHEGSRHPQSTCL